MLACTWKMLIQGVSFADDEGIPVPIGPMHEMHRLGSAFDGLIYEIRVVKWVQVAPVPHSKRNACFTPIPRARGTHRRTMVAIPQNVL